MERPIGRVVRIFGLVLALVVRHASARDDADRVRTIPLGSTIEAGPGDRSFGVFIPTRYGGELTIATNEGRVGPIVGPDGRERANGADLGPDSHGWHTFTVADAPGPHAVSASFVQAGRSQRTPWNFYYWPTKSDSIHEPWAGGNGRVDTPRAFGDDVLVAAPGGPILPGQDIVLAGPNGLLETPVASGDDSTWFPNLYDDSTFRGADGTIHRVPSPLLKYDQLFRTSARRFEAANSQTKDLSRWPGHCLGGAVASLLLNEPVPAPGSGMTRDELKALWAELGENHRNHRIGDYVVDIPPGPPRPGPDACDRFVPAVHQLLEVHLRGRRTALLGNLRAFPPTGAADEVWNHAIGEYTARYSAIPGADVHATSVVVELVANSGSSLEGQEDRPRVIRYAYTLHYRPDGRVDEARAGDCDWIGVEGEAMYAPLNLIELLGSQWAGHNPAVTEANVRSLDLANGGDASRFAGAAPSFQPVTDLETGLARRPGLAWGSGSSELPRRGGLLRRLTGR